MGVPGDWRIAGAVRTELQILRTSRVNLLLHGTERIIQSALDMLRPDLSMPIENWRPGKPLALPPTEQAGTMILREVGALTADDQRRLLAWLELAARQTQVISTTTSRLLPAVHAGAFLETLYYRLNAVYVDLNDVGRELTMSRHDRQPVSTY